MELIDQYKKVDSQEQTLLSGTSLVDSRTEADWLCQLADIAALLNFYNNENHLAGNWRPFLLKDPVFLLASISKTDYAKFYKSYINIRQQLKPLVLKADFSNPVICEGFNRLFDLLTDVFFHIGEWVYYMQLSDHDYPLKKHLIHKVKTVYSTYLWAIVSLRRELFVLYGKEGISPVDEDQLYPFNYSNDTLWKTNMDKMPYWDILDIKVKTVKNYFTGLENAGHVLFEFFHNIIKNAATGLQELSIKKCKYPDTLLLRAFVNLLKVHQDQFNGITKKYFSFYYKDILQFTELPAVPDKVFICANLAKKDINFILPAGTLFDAGMDLQNKPIVFSSVEETNLNPGNITDVYTLTAVQDANNHSSIYLQSINNFDTVNTDENGYVQSWETFGAVPGIAATKQTQAISFGSPLLLLREGQRSITLTLTFASKVSDNSAQAVNVYLSTAQTWLKLSLTDPGLNFKYNVVNDLTVIISISLNASQSAIEAFSKTTNGLDPDNLGSEWPMVKIEFDSFADLINPPSVTAFKIDVYVFGVKTLALYNDYGMLEPKTAYPLFGPTPLVNSNFFIGSNEIFSKPLQMLFLEMYWDYLPADFSVYYKAYNSFLAPVTPSQFSTGNQQAPVQKQSWLKKIFKGILSAIIPPVKWIPGLFNKTPKPVPASVTPSQQAPVSIAGSTTAFNNQCFTVNSGILQSGQWNNLVLFNVPATVTTNTSIKPTFNSNNPSGAALTTGNSVLLFDTDINAAIKPTVFFAYDFSMQSQPVFTPDPQIQQTLLQFTDETASGFIRLSLTGPDYLWVDNYQNGFGSTLYPGVVSYVAFKNVSAIINKASITNPPNLPFAPKLKSMAADYVVSKQYSFDPAADNYPIQCFHYTPFANYNVYDSTTSAKTNGLPLYKSLPVQGNLYLGLKNLLPLNKINFYFQLTNKNTVGTQDNTVLYEYLGADGWKTLPVLSDETSKFSSPGIITVNIPADIVNTSAAMPGSDYWIHIAVNNSTTSFPQTTFLKTNAVLLERKVADVFSTLHQYQLPARIIKKSITTIPQILSVIQPFPSFGGVSSEKEDVLKKRISGRIKTKDRAVTTEDYFRLIKQNFPAVYYSRTVVESSSKAINVYVIKACDNITDAGAFEPLVNKDMLASLQQFLSERAQPFFSLHVSNFVLHPIQVIAEVIIKKGYEPGGMQENINQALNLFLSPWIKGTGKHISLDKPITNARLRNFILDIEGVSAVQSVSFIIQGWPVEIPVQLTGDMYLPVSCMQHNIQCNIENEQ